MIDDQGNRVSILELFYAAYQPFFWHPERAYMVAVFFLGLLITRVGVNKKNIRVKFSWPLLLAFISWVLFGINEYIAHLYESNIRLDLLLSWPVMLAISVYATYFFIKVSIRKED